MMNKKISKVLAIGLAATLMCGSFVGCGKQPEKEVGTKAEDEKDVATENKDEVKETNEEITLRISTMFGGTDPSTESFETSLKTFMEKHPNVTIKNESMTSVGDEYRTKVKTDFATGNEPDITFFYTGADVKGIIDSGKVVSYEEVWKNYPEVGKDITDGVKNSVRYEDGNLYCLPLTGFYEGMFVNKAIFDQYGLELPNTWGNLLKAVEVLNENKVVPFAGPIGQSHYMIEHFVLSQAGAEGHKDVLDGEIPENWVKAFNNIKELYEKEAFSKDALTMDIEGAENLFKQEKAAMILEGSWFIGGCEDELKDKMVIMPMPVATDGKMDPTSLVAGFSSGYFISKKAYDDESRQKVVVELVDYLTQAEQIKSIAGANGGTPAAKVTVDGLHELYTEGHAMVANAKTLNMPIDSRLTPEAFNYIVKDGTPYIVVGKRTPEEVLTEVKALNEK